MTQAVWKSLFISLLHRSYGESWRMRVRNGLGRSAFLCVCFCSAGLLIVTQFAVCWYILLLKYLRDGTWQVKDSLSLGGQLCSLVYPNALFGSKMHCKGDGTGRIKSSHLFNFLPSLFNQCIPPLILAGNVIG